MTSKDDALKLALEALESAEDQLAKPYSTGVRYAITAIREALADSALERMAKNAKELGLDYEPAQQQEPFGYFRYDLRLDAWVQNREGRPGTPFYTSPPASKPWVGLTDEERGQIINANFGTGLWAMAKDIEAKLKEKNGF